MTYGRDLDTMLTGAGVLSGAAVWIAKQIAAWREARQARAHRTWHGYIPVEGLATWDVRVISQSRLLASLSPVEDFDAGAAKPLDENLLKLVAQLCRAKTLRSV
jgi:hypothetical protein